jgi:hypothetical protein
LPNLQPGIFHKSTQTGQKRKKKTAKLARRFSARASQPEAYVAYIVAVAIWSRLTYHIA